MGQRVHLERLPGYAPEVHPQEQVWNVLKRRELKHRWCRDLAHLRQELVHAKERLRHRQSILQHCFSHALAVVSLVLTRSISGAINAGDGFGLMPMLSQTFSISGGKSERLDEALAFAARGILTISCLTGDREERVTGQRR